MEKYGLTKLWQTFSESSIIIKVETSQSRKRTRDRLNCSVSGDEGRVDWGVLQPSATRENLRTRRIYEFPPSAQAIQAKGKGYRAFTEGDSGARGYL